MKNCVKYAQKGKIVKYIMGWCPIPGANIIQCCSAAVMRCCSRERNAEPELNPMERWNVGILGVESGESGPFGSGALRLRISEFILRDEGPEARGKEFLALGLKSAAGGRSSNLYQGNTARSEFFETS